MIYQTNCFSLATKCLYVQVDGNLSLLYVAAQLGTVPGFVGTDCSFYGRVVTSAAPP